MTKIKPNETNMVVLFKSPASGMWWVRTDTGPIGVYTDIREALEAVLRNTERED